MEVVRVFNNELSSLYEVKPPISKAKMTQITKSAIKGIKFYKHIVQSVEKFIQKCRPEYKVPGLYVVDSIVRQSRHQFGADKDVFGPRFVKNIHLTFQHLFKCNPDDRPKIIRVLNLWQKNTVFPIDIIQPLLDMGHPNTSSEWPNDPPPEIKESPHKPLNANEENQASRHKSAESWKGWPAANDEDVSDTRNYAEMSTKNLEKFMKSEMSNALEEEEALFRKQEKLAEENTVKFNKKLLDFDYGDEEDEEEAKNDDNLSSAPNALALSMAQNLLSNPELLRQLQQMQQTIQQQNEALNSDQGQHSNKPEVNDSSYSSDAPSSPQQPPLPTYEAPHLPLPPSESDKDDRIIPQPPLPPQDLDERSLAAIMTPHRPLPPTTIGAYIPTGIPLTGQAEGDKDDRIIPDSAPPPRDLDERSLAAILAPLERGILPPMPFTESSTMMPYQNSASFPPPQPPLPLMDPISMEAPYPPALPPDPHMMQSNQTDEDERVLYSIAGEPPPHDFDERAVVMPVEERVKKDRSRSRSGSRSRGRSGRHRSRSKSPRRKRSRSRSRSRKSSRAEERERIREKERERERERERKKKGLPPIKKGFVSVCSTTLWLGHVPKSCTEGDISSTFREYGTILSIDMIPPRGCAYVVMDRRQDAHRALQKLKNLKLQSSLVKMAWAPGKGVKGKEYKEFWEVSAGVSYVPYEKIAEDAEALDLLEEGGFIDEDSLPESLKALRSQLEEKSAFSAANPMPMEPVTTTFNPMQGPPMVPPPIIPPSSVNLPGMVLPHLMQPQFGLPLPGLLPPQAMVMQVPMGIPPPNPMLMVQQQSQNMLNPQSLPMGLPQMIPRAVPPVPTALQNLKSAEPAVNSPAVPASDATPTDEDGTSVSSPGTVLITNSASTSMTVSTQQPVPINQFNPLLNLQNANRSMMSVPPPVSSAGAPIPYPPPNVGFSFPPPGVRPPGQTLHTPQFSWMQQKPVNSYSDAESLSSNSIGSRIVQPSGMPPHMFANRPPFPEKTLPTTQAPVNESRESSSLERKSTDMEISGNRSSSPGHHDMVISTDDESSMDREFPRNDMSGPRFQGPTEFPRMPLHNMRGPPAPMQGMRFPRGMGAPFPARMGGPRSMGMHPGQRMEMDFHPGPPGPRMLGNARRENASQEGRDWYPRDYECPPFEREKRYEREEWPREPWMEKHDVDSGRPPRERDDREAGERRGSRNHSEEEKGFSESRSKHKNAFEENSEQSKPKPAKKSKPNKDLLDDMLKLRFYQRDKSANYASHLTKQLESKKKKLLNDKTELPKKENPKDENLVSPNRGAEADHKSEENTKKEPTKKDKDKEARKRSRWGRTLSEEREFQQIKRNEIEMKFQSYEQSSREQQQLAPDLPECDNTPHLNPEVSTCDPETVATNSLPESDTQIVSEVTDASATEQLNSTVTTEHSNNELINKTMCIDKTGETDLKEIDPVLPSSTVDDVPIAVPNEIVSSES